MCFGTHISSKFVVLRANGVAMAPHGLILCEHGATPSKNLFKYHPGLFRAFPYKNRKENQEESDYIIYPWLGSHLDNLAASP